MKKHLLIFALIPMLLAGQTKDTAHVRTTKAYLELMSIPALHLSAGIGIKSGARSEHVLSLNYLFLPYILYSGGMRYNFNYFILQKKRFDLYVPIWAGTRRAHTYGYDEAAPVDYLFFSTGSGFGCNFKFRNRHFIKLELGAGAALNINNDPYDQKLHRYRGREFRMDELAPVVPSLRFNIRYAIPIKSI